MVVRESNIFFYRYVSPGLLVVFFGTYIFSTILIQYKYVSNTSSSTGATYKIVKPLFQDNTKHDTDRISVRDAEAAATFATIQSAGNFSETDTATHDDNTMKNVTMPTTINNNKPLIMNDTQHDAVKRLQDTETATVPITPATCALLFFGVPRLFRLVAFPSIQKYILDVNAKCDVFVHTYNVTKLSVARNNETDGTLVPSDVYMLQPKAVHIEDVKRVFKLRPINFFRRNHYKYWGPCCGSTENMVKQWHSIDGAWKLMENYASKTNQTYRRVGLFRLDVFYTHPIPIMSNDEEHAVVPNFLWKEVPEERLRDNSFVNDRMFYGDYLNAQIWATRRFDLVQKYVNQNRHSNVKGRYGDGIHSESFIQYLLQNITSLQKKDICFWRLRTTGRITIDDCESSDTILYSDQNKALLSQSMNCCWDCFPLEYNCTEKHRNSKK